MQCACLPVRKINACKTLLFVALTVSAGVAQSADTLRSAIAQSLETHPEVRFEAEALNALREDRREVWGGYLPSVDIDLSAGRADRQYDLRGSFDRHYAELSVTQMLFDGFRVRSQVHEADYRLLEQYKHFRLDDNGIPVYIPYPWPTGSQ